MATKNSCCGARSPVSLLDHFAGHAMSGLLSGLSDFPTDHSLQVICSRAYKVADFMFAAATRPATEDPDIS